MNPVLYAFGLSEKKLSELRFFCMKHKIRLFAVKPQQYSLPIESLLAAPQEAGEEGEGEKIAEEMLLFADFPAPLFNGMLALMRARTLPPVSLKAVLTETNRRWSGAQLYAALCEERAAFARGEFAHGKE